ncbi:hypothetical protein ACFYXQ_41785 [Nocardia jiangxiensis]|uniref:Restriction endonuclease n=1 Tax=Nocardia jiangxiensis TaxID=282685 RepID=A0ABW6SDB6_9NOCA
MTDASRPGYPVPPGHSFGVPQPSNAPGFPPSNSPGPQRRSRGLPIVLSVLSVLLIVGLVVFTVVRIGQVSDTTAQRQQVARENLATAQLRLTRTPAVHFTGRMLGGVSSSSQWLQVDLMVTNVGEATGTVGTSSGASLNYFATGGKSFLEGAADAWTAFGVPADTAANYAGHNVLIPPSLFTADPAAVLAPINLAVALDPAAAHDKPLRIGTPVTIAGHRSTPVTSGNVTVYLSDPVRHTAQRSTPSPTTSSAPQGTATSAASPPPPAPTTPTPVLPAPATPTPAPQPPATPSPAPQPPAASSVAPPPATPSPGTRPVGMSFPGTQSAVAATIAMSPGAPSPAVSPSGVSVPAMSSPGTLSAPARQPSPGTQSVATTLARTQYPEVRSRATSSVAIPPSQTSGPVSLRLSSSSSAVVPARYTPAHRGPAPSGVPSSDEPSANESGDPVPDIDRIVVDAGASAPGEPQLPQMDLNTSSADGDRTEDLYDAMPDQVNTLSDAIDSRVQLNGTVTGHFLQTPCDGVCTVEFDVSNTVTAGPGITIESVDFTYQVTMSAEVAMNLGPECQGEAVMPANGSKTLTCTATYVPPVASYEGETFPIEARVVCHVRAMGNAQVDAVRKQVTGNGQKVPALNPDEPEDAADAAQRHTDSGSPIPQQQWTREYNRISSRAPGTGGMRSEQEEAVSAALDRLSVKQGDRAKILANLRAGDRTPAGAEVAEIIGSEHLKDMEGYADQVSALAQSSATGRSAAAQQLRFGDELYRRGQRNLVFERKVDGVYDIDVGVKGSDGHLLYGYQLKETGNPRNASNSVVRQLVNAPADHKVGILDVPFPASQLSDATAQSLAQSAQRGGLTYYLRFSDGATRTIPGDGSVFPGG